jgi:protocatechuate 3,4-dioxygenase beta subunit
MADGRAVGVGVPPATSVTDEAGSYAIAALPPGTYSVSAHCGPDSKRIKLDAGEETALDFVCPANAAISGHVLDPNGDPAVDAFVWLLKAEYQGGVLKQIVIGPKVTAEDGAYAFDDALEANRRYYVLVDVSPPEEVVPAAAADLKEREPIQVPTYYPSATRMDSATPVMLQPGEHREQVDIKIATSAFYCIEGKISASGAPASSGFAIQDPALAGTRLVRLRSGSGEDGKYHACGVPSDSYRLSTEEGFTEFALSSSDLEHVDLSVDPAHLSLHVEWDGEPPTGSEIPKLDAAAEATLHKMAALMGMGDAPSDDFLKGLANRLRHPDLNDTELVSAFQRMQGDADFPMEMGNLMGQLRPRDSVVNVTLSGATNNLARSLGAMIPSDSPFRDGIPPGDYAVGVQAFGSSSAYAKEMTYNGLKLADGILRIPPAATGTLHVAMAAGATTLTATVTDADGKGVPDATVIVVPDAVTSVPLLSRDVIHGKTDQNGTYGFHSLPPGKYRVLATTQSVRWGVPEDLEKVLLVLFQAKDVELDAKAALQITLEPIPIY